MERSPIDVLRLPLASLPDPLLIPAVGGDVRVGAVSSGRTIDASFVPPGSKSLTNRVLPLAALGTGIAIIERPLLDADDAQRMIAALQQLGVRVEQATDELGAELLRVHGVQGRWHQPDAGITLDLGNAGTATRFMAALACLGRPEAGPITIDGNARMRQRPIGELVELLRAIGVRVDELGSASCPPIRVHPVEDLASLKDELVVGATASSQFVSAMMMLGSFLPRGLTVRFRQPPTSLPYLTMTIGLLRQLGVAVVGEPPEAVHVGGWVSTNTRSGLPHKMHYEVEPDASGATYFLALAAAIPGARVRCPGLANSLQGDARFVDWLEQMGAVVERDAATGSMTVIGAASLRGIAADGSQMPDAAMTLAALAVFADGPTTITGLRTLRVKETDRLAALRNELSKTGAGVAIVTDPATSDESLVITPPLRGIARSGDVPAIVFDTYDDHRMAMACAIVGVVRSRCSINDPGCVAKTYPGYWSALAGVLATAEGDPGD